MSDRPSSSPIIDYSKYALEQRKLIAKMQKEGYPNQIILAVLNAPEVKSSKGSWWDDPFWNLFAKPKKKVAKPSNTEPVGESPDAGLAALELQLEKLYPNDPEKVAQLMTQASGGGTEEQKSFEWTPEAIKSAEGMFRAAGWSTQQIADIMPGVTSNTMVADVGSAVQPLLQLIDPTKIDTDAPTPKFTDLGDGRMLNVLTGETFIDPNYKPKETPEETGSWISAGNGYIVNTLTGESKRAFPEDQPLGETAADFRNYWANRSNAISDQRLNAGKLGADFFLNQQNLNAQRQRDIANLGPEEWMQKSSLTGEPQDVDWLSMLGVDAGSIEQYKQTSQNWFAEKQKQAQEKEKVIKAYGDALTTWQKAAETQKTFSEMMQLPEYSWFKDWMGTPNEMEGRAILAKGGWSSGDVSNAAALPSPADFGDMPLPPNLSMYDTDATPNPLANFIQSTPIQEAGPETWYNQLSSEQRGMYTPLMQAKGWYDPQDRLRKLHSGVLYGGIKRGQQVY